MNRIYYLALLLIMMLPAHSRDFAVYDSKTGARLDINAFAKEVLKADLVFFGEFHDDSVIHSIQRDLLAAMYTLNPKTAVSLEMFERDAGPFLDDYLAGKITEAEFLKKSRPWPDYEKFYKPLVEMAKTNNAPVIAANVPRKYAAIYSAQGMTGIRNLPENERAFTARRVNVKEDMYMENFFKTMAGNMGMDASDSADPNTGNTLFLFYGAQVLKDETMAESIVDFMDKNKDYKVIHFNGDFHSNNYLGTVQKVADRKPDMKIAVITPVYVKTGEKPGYDPQYKEQCDFVIVMQELTRPVTPPMMMPGMHTPPNGAAVHTVSITLDPDKHRLEGRDKVKMKNPVVKSARFKMLKSVKINKVSSPDAELEYRIGDIKDDEFYSSIVVRPKSNELNEIIFEYGGEVRNSPEVTLLNQRHSNTPGIVSDSAGEGIYLPAGSYYPYTENDMADFDITVSVPKDITVITSGKYIPINSGEGANHTVRYTSELPADEFILVGGRYVLKDTTVDGRKFGVYMFKDSPLAVKYLSAVVNDYLLYTKLLGPYPYSSFSIVENFFATGFGMPGYTLLSNKLMAMPWVTLMPGSLPHEFVHNWWGNSVYVNYDMGNWCEALTTFCSNYYHNILTGKPDQALDWRKKALIAVNELPESANYPVARFKYQKNNDDATIGYQKGGFIFYELMKLTGEKTFFASLQKFAAKYKGKRAGWMSLLSTFDAQCKADSSSVPAIKVLSQWLNSSSVPTLTLGKALQENGKLNFSIDQDGVYLMSVPIVMDYGDSKEKVYFTIREQTNNFSVDLKKPVRSVTLDPDYECLRKLCKWEIPYTFNLTLTDKPLLVLPGRNTQAYPLMEQFVSLMKESGYDFEARPADELKDADWKERSIVVVGDQSANPFLKNILNKLPGGVAINDTAFLVNGRSLSAADNMMLLNYAHPTAKDKFMTVIYISNPSNVDPFRRLFRYLSYSMLVVSKTKAGMPQAQMELFPTVGNKEKMVVEF